MQTIVRLIPDESKQLRITPSQQNLWPRNGDVEKCVIKYYIRFTPVLLIDVRIVHFDHIIGNL